MSIRHYFLGSSTASGFKTPVSELLSDTDNTVYILKGTAGSGKSTLMKKVSEAFGGSPQEIYHCSADPFSLDAVYITDRKAIIIDGTSPHCFDPVYPKAVESIIDLGAMLETGKLRAAKEEIISLTDEYSGCHRRCRLCLSALSSVTDDVMAAASEALLRDKLSAFTSRFINKLIPKKAEKATAGNICRRQLSAITMNGCHTYIPESGSVYLLNDSPGAGAAAFLAGAAERISAKGYDVYISECYLSSGCFIEHLIIPELDISLLSSSFINCLSVDNAEKTVNFSRFYDNDILNGAAVKQRIRFGKKAAAEFIKEASAALIDAKIIHDRIEEHYIAAADFDSLNRLAYKLISEIKGL